MIADGQAALLEYRLDGELRGVVPGARRHRPGRRLPVRRRSGAARAGSTSPRCCSRPRCRWRTARGCPTMSMLRGAEPYKQRWRPAEAVEPPRPAGPRRAARAAPAYAAAVRARARRACRLRQGPRAVAARASATALRRRPAPLERPGHAMNGPARGAAASTGGVAGVRRSPPASTSSPAAGTSPSPAPTAAGSPTTWPRPASRACAGPPGAARARSRWPRRAGCARDRRAHRPGRRCTCTRPRPGSPAGCAPGSPAAADRCSSRTAGPGSPSTAALRAASLAWERAAARWTDLFVCVGAAEAEAGPGAGRPRPVRGGAQRRRPAPVPSAGDRRRAPPPGTGSGLDPAAPLAVCVGRVTRQKGQDVLLAAWPRGPRGLPGRAAGAGRRRRPARRRCARRRRPA